MSDTANPFKFPLKITARDSVTGFSGIITGRAEYIAGCRQYCLAPKVKPDGSVTDPHWFDEEPIEPVPDIAAARVEPTRTGGPTGSDSAPTR